MVESRLREVSIRRVLGAGGGRILALFSRDFLRLLGWAAVLSFPVVFWRVSGWLGTFAFRVRLGPWYFVGGLVLMALLLLFAVGWPLLRTARTDPACHLRSE
jgi:ABC-type antimicrobial peptide transport system permease subunit